MRPRRIPLRLRANTVHHIYNRASRKPKYETTHCDDCGRRLRQRLDDPPTKRVCTRCYDKMENRNKKKYATERRRSLRATRRVGERMLVTAERILRASARFDTSVRDTVAEGLAYIVHAAYDAIGLEKKWSGKRSCTFRADHTREWFVKRGFVEWFANGAASLWSSSYWPKSWHRFQRRRRSPSPKRQTRKSR